MASSGTDFPDVELRPATPGTDVIVPDARTVDPATGFIALRVTAVLGHQAARELLVETIKESGRFKIVVRQSFTTTRLYASASIDSGEEAMTWHDFVLRSLLDPNSDLSQLCVSGSYWYGGGAMSGPIDPARESPPLPEPEDGVVMDWSY